MRKENIAVDVVINKVGRVTTRSEHYSIFHLAYMKIDGWV